MAPTTKSSSSKKKRTRASSSRRRKAADGNKNNNNNNNSSIFKNNNYYIKMVSRWITIKIIDNCGGGAHALSRRLSPSTIAVTSIAAFCLAVIALSQLDCFHIHQGLAGSLENLRPTGLKIDRESGHIDFNFKADGKIVYDQDAAELMSANPDLNIFDLDLGCFKFEPEELGFVDPRDMQKAFGVDVTNNVYTNTNMLITNDDNGNNIKAGAAGNIVAGIENHFKRGEKFTSIGKQKKEEPLFKVSGERIRKALRLREEKMPLPSVLPS